MIRVLALSRYQQLGASSRMRFYQYLPALMAASIEVDVAPLFSNNYVRGIQRERRSLLHVVHAYAQRVRRLWRKQRQYDLLWIEKELLPWIPAWLEHAMLSGGMPYVLDYDDAVFHYYDQHRNLLVRRWLGRKHLALMRGAALVVAGNEYLADYARKAGAQKVEVMPTVIDLDRYPPPQCNVMVDATVPCVGWIGQRATSSFLRPLAPVFARLAAEDVARFAAIGIDAAALGLPMQSIGWSEATEVASISSLDIGIMPLVDEPFERGKCGYKLIQYMACGLPVVASPVGVNRQIVEHGVNGFLAETPAQWEEALRTLLGDAALRQRMGQAGRRLVEQKYCLQVTGPRLAELLVSACGRQV